MAEKKVLTRVILKHDTAENWAKATNFVPNKGEFIIYDTLDASGNKVADAVRYKIGDGKTNVNSLPFAVVDGTTSTKGIVKLEDSTTSTSTTTAATPNSVKVAYDKANEVAEDLAELESSLASVATSGDYSHLSNKPKFEFDSISGVLTITY